MLLLLFGMSRLDNPGNLDTYSSISIELDFKLLKYSRLLVSYLLSFDVRKVRIITEFFRDYIKRIE